MNFLSLSSGQEQLLKKTRGSLVVDLSTAVMRTLDKGTLWQLDTRRAQTYFGFLTLFMVVSVPSFSFKSVSKASVLQTWVTIRDCFLNTVSFISKYIFLNSSSVRLPECIYTWTTDRRIHQISLPHHIKGLVPGCHQWRSPLPNQIAYWWAF